MSTGLSVSKATYGAGSTTVDVTSAVSSKIKDGVLNFTVSPSSFNVEDPAPGQIKQVEISYTVNGGSTNSVTKKDGDLVSIDAPPVRMASGLQITKAEYGYSGNYTDVTNAVQDLMKSDGSINLKVGFKEVGLPDPNPNKQKQLNVEYTINGSPTKDTFKDGETFKISAPAKEDTSNKQKLGDSVNSFFFTLFLGALKFCGVFLYAISVFTAYEYGNYFIHPYFWGAIAFFLPFFSFWGLPFITFAVRLFRPTDIVPA
jgi:hypothetical protein